MTDRHIVRRNVICPWCGKAVSGEAIREGLTGFNKRGRYYHQACLRSEVERRMKEVNPVAGSMMITDWERLVDFFTDTGDWQVAVLLPPVVGSGRGRPRKTPPEGGSPEE